jgi:hypothetical protein
MLVSIDIRREPDAGAAESRRQWRSRVCGLNTRASAKVGEEVHAEPRSRMNAITIPHIRSCDSCVQLELGIEGNTDMYCCESFIALSYNQTNEKNPQMHR